LRDKYILLGAGNYYTIVFLDPGNGCCVLCDPRV
jgi:hypothetical protein